MVSEREDAVERMEEDRERPPHLASDDGAEQIEALFGRLGNAHSA